MKFGDSRNVIQKNFKILKKKTNFTSRPIKKFQAGKTQKLISSEDILGAHE